MRTVRFTQSARKHRIGRARALEALEDAGDPSVIPAEEGLDERLLFIGRDGSGRVLEIIAVELADYLLVMHVMPYDFRRRREP